MASSSTCPPRLHPTNTASSASSCVAAPVSDLSFDRLVAAIQQVHVEMAARASRAVNRSLTLRNWLIGLYIAEYEQRGAQLLPTALGAPMTIRESPSPELGVPASDLLARLSFSHIAS